MKYLFIFVLCYVFAFSCKSKKDNKRDDYDNYDAKYEGNGVAHNKSLDEPCITTDGEHPASVGYYNPKTGHHATYDLTVTIQDCEVTIIHFPKGGWIDEDHIQPVELDHDGNALVIDEKGRRYSVHLDEPTE